MASLPPWHIQMGTFTPLSPSQALDKDDEIIILRSIDIWIVYNQMSLSPFVILSNFSPTSDWLKRVILDFCRELRKLLSSLMAWLSPLCIMRTPCEFLIHSCLILKWHSINTSPAEVWDLFFHLILFMCMSTPCPCQTLTSLLLLVLLLLPQCHSFSPLSQFPVSR